ncbi:MAG: A/G-specific adenine glycosylase [Gammaproteobacteria bacterium]
MNAKNFAKSLLSWYDQNGRSSLPWRQNITPYRVWLSEIMLQQTQVKTVLPYFERFISKYPSIASLSQANLDEILHLWAGLGYYTRARNLYKTAQIIQKDHKGQFPSTVHELMTLPGIGRSTAGAIAAIAFGKHASILDGNVKRILCRLHEIPSWPGELSTTKKLWELAENYTPKERTNDYTQAIMDLGATLCTQTKPKCVVCPIRKHCMAFTNDTTSEYPVKKAKKSLPIKQTQMLLIMNDRKQILLLKRPTSGIWGGLWSLPECEIDLKATTWCDEKLGLKVKEHSKLSVFKHTFTHFQLIIHPVLLNMSKKHHALPKIMEIADFTWFDPKTDAKLGLPTPVKKILDNIEAE